MMGAGVPIGAGDGRTAASIAERLLLPQRRALLHEWGLYLASHPVLWALAEVSRRVGGVVRLPGIGTVVNDPEVARAILQREADFTKGGPGGFGERITAVMGPYALLNMDGDEHRALRRKLADLFSPASAAALTAAVFDAPLRDLRARLDTGEAVDLVPVVRELTGRMTCHLLGIAVPLGEEATFGRVVDLSERLSAFAGLSTRPLTPARIRAIRAPFEELAEVARAGYDDPDADPDAIVSRLRALGLGFAEVRGVLAALFLVGTQTVSVAVPRIVALLLDSGEFAPLRRDPARLPGAIDEGLRCVVPTPAMVRAVARDTAVGGRRFRAGTRVLLLTYNLAKSERSFPRAWRFDPARRHDPRARHLWYGAGPHFCLGFALAQQEIRAILETLLAVEGRLTIGRRAAARGVLLPRYARLVLRARP